MTQVQPLFGDWVSRLRRALDLTQQELADRVGCSVSALRKIESGERRPSREIAELLATHLEVSADQRAVFLNLARRDLPPQAPPETGDIAASAPVTPELAAERRNIVLPAAPTPIVGREHELATIVTLLREPGCRMVTLVGPGGIGKSRLALQIAAESHCTPADGIWYVDLTAVDAPDLMAQTIAASITCQISPSIPLREQLVSFLQGRELLLVLDNLEHLLEGVDLLAEMMQRAARLKILTTSRERLNLQGEWVLEVQGLPAPENEERFEDSSAVRLFLQSARRARVGFEADTDDRRAIVQICRQVEGIPLAIELAAGWVRILSCREIADEIARDPRILASSTRDLPLRHRSMGAVFDQSWRLLGEPDRDHLRRLSVFRGGFDRDLAEQVAGATLADLSSLVARSLVRRSGPHRYDMQELVRQYCRERLLESGRAAETAADHADAMRRLAIQARSHLIGPQQMVWLDRLQLEVSNLRAALEWCVASATFEAGLQMAASLAGFWYQRDLQSEGRRWLEQFLAATPLPMAGPGATQNTVQAAASGAPESTGATHDPLLRADALAALAYLTYEMGDFVEAGARLQEALRIPETSENPNVLASVLVSLGQVQGSLGEYDAARATLERALALAQDDMYAQRRRASALMALADVTGLSGDDERAQFLYAASTAIYRDVGDSNAVAYALRKWGWSALRCDEVDAADALVRESLTLNQQTGSKIGMIACLVCLGAIAFARGEVGDAASLIVAAQGLMERHQVRLRPMDELGLARMVRALAAEGDGAILANAAAFRGLTLEDALAQLVERQGDGAKND